MKLTKKELYRGIIWALIFLGSVWVGSNLFQLKHSELYIVLLLLACFAVALIFRQLRDKGKGVV